MVIAPALHESKLRFWMRARAVFAPASRCEDHREDGW
jgi:hypothetical protein